MKWNQFTKNNIALFSNKYLLEKENILLTTIKDERKNIKNYIRNLNVDFNITTIDNNNNDIKNFCNVSWVDMKGVIKELNTIDITYKIMWNNNKIMIRTTLEQFKYIKKQLNVIIYMIEYLKFKSDNMNKNVTVYLILTNLEKEFPNKSHMSIKNANSGYTDLDKDIIFIWRYEEFEKVLFHELMHFFNMDTRNHDFDNHINTKGIDPSYYEVFTDFLGIIYHIIFISILSKIKIKTLLELELAFIENQAMILNNYLKLKNWNSKPKKVITQTSPAFSYYILKYMLFNYATKNDVMKYILEDKTNILLKEIISDGFIMKPFIKIKSSRMTLLQLK